MTTRKTPSFLDICPDGVVLDVRVQPKASRTAIVGPLGDSLKIAVSAPPVDGKANAALVKFLSKTFGISKSAVQIVGGESSRRKRIQFRGLTPAEAVRVLRAHLPAETV